MIIAQLKLISVKDNLENQKKTRSGSFNDGCTELFSFVLEFNDFD
jgi:hypothetical protein